VIEEQESEALTMSVELLKSLLTAPLYYSSDTSGNQLCRSPEGTLLFFRGTTLERTDQMRCPGSERGSCHNVLMFTRDMVDFSLSSKELLPIDRSEVVVDRLPVQVPEVHLHDNVSTIRQRNTPV
jgi:hypothetical protein